MSKSKNNNTGNINMYGTTLSSSSKSKDDSIFVEDTSGPKLPSSSGNAGSSGGVQIGVNTLYFDELGTAKTAASNLHSSTGIEVKDTFNMPFVQKFYEIYDSYTKTLNDLSNLLDHDLGRFHTASQNMIDRDNGIAGK